jgi:hypothetical protein
VGRSGHDEEMARMALSSCNYSSLEAAEALLSEWGGGCPQETDDGNAADDEGDPVPIERLDLMVPHRPQA